MNQYGPNFFDDGELLMCDCCGVTNEDHELHSLDILCEITLCRNCIQQFYALLSHSTKPAGKLTVLYGKAKEEK